MSSSRHQDQQVAESILRYFSGFEAFYLPPPTAEEDIMRTLNENRSRVLPQFLTKLEEFKTLLKSTLFPKRSCFDGQLVTGEGNRSFYTFRIEWRISKSFGIVVISVGWDTNQNLLLLLNLYQQQCVILTFHSYPDGLLSHLIFFLHLVSQPINTIKYKLQRMSMEITYGGDKNNFTINST